MESNHKLSHSKEVDPEALGYEYFSIKIDNQTAVNINRKELLQLVSGDNVSLSIAGKAITISSTAVAGTSYTHPNKTWADKLALTGANVITNLTIDSKGHPTDWSVRALTPTDIGAAPSHSHPYDNYVNWQLKVGNVTNDITTDELVSFISSASNDIVIENGNIVVKRKNKVVENVTGTSVGKVSDHNNKWMNITGTNAVFTVAGTFVKDDEIEGSFTGTGRLTVVGSGISIVYPTEFHQNKIPKGGAFALKFITATQAILFGRLIPLGL